MKKIITLVFLISSIYSFNTLAQAAKIRKDQVGLNVGYNFSFLYDRNFSPLFYQEQGIVYSINYEWIGNKTIFFAGLNFSQGKLMTKISDFFESKYIKGEIDLGYLRRAFTSGNGKFQHYLGGGLHSYNHYIDYDDQESFSFLFAHSIDLKYTAMYNISDRNRLQFRISLPVLTLLTRPPYNGYDEELKENEESPLKLITNGTITSVNNYFAVNSQFIYSYSLSQRFDMNCQYKFSLHRSQMTEKLVHIQNQIFVGASLKF